MQEVNVTVTRILLNQHMNLYNTKLILSSPKQTPNSVRTPEEADKAKKALTANAAAIAMEIMETVHERF